MSTREEAMKAVKVILEYIEDSSDREGLQKTPERVINSFDEIYAGYGMDAEEVLSSMRFILIFPCSLAFIILSIKEEVLVLNGISLITKVFLSS